MTNWGAHHLDIAQWGLGMDESGPVEIEATCRYNRARIYEVPETFHITYKYASGTVMECNSGENKYKMGTRFEGEKGVVYVNRGTVETEPEDILDTVLKETDQRLYVSRNHHQNWLECIKTRKLPICDVAIGHRSATVCHLGNIAVRTGKKIVWDPVKEEMVGDAELAKWAGKPYRAPWKLPEV
jgi:predicted dehydrogenase